MSGARRGKPGRQFMLLTGRCGNNRSATRSGGQSGKLSGQEYGRAKNGRESCQTRTERLARYVTRISIASSDTGTGSEDTVGTQRAPHSTRSIFAMYSGDVVIIEARRAPPPGPQHWWFRYRLIGANVVARDGYNLTNKTLEDLPEPEYRDVFAPSGRRCAKQERQPITYVN